MPTEWTRVIEEMPADMLLPLPPGYVLLVPGAGRFSRRYSAGTMQASRAAQKIRIILASEGTPLALTRKSR